MQGRRTPARSTNRTRTLSAPQTSRVEVVYFPKRQPGSTADPATALGSSYGPDRDALAYHREKLHALLRGKRRALEGLNQVELTEVAIFGHALYEQGQIQQARVVFEGLVAQEPREAFPYTMLGAIFLAQDDLHQALALFEAALDIDRDDLAALVYRGEIRLRLGQRGRARGDLELALELDPGRTSPFSARAEALLASPRRRVE